MAPTAFAINDFGLRLLRTLTFGKEAQNTVISPVSVAMALAMTYNGAAGETHLAMMQALRIEALGDDFNPLNRALLKTIKAPIRRCKSLSPTPCGRRKASELRRIS